MAELSGQTFAGYEIIAKLGEGGFGAVYKARQPNLNRLVALKILAPHLASDADFVARFKREATLAASLNHPNLVLVFAAGQSDGSHYMAMEFVEGETLRNRIESHGRLDPREATAIAVYVAQALQYAWNKSRLIHRDIKPDNVFVSKTGEVKVGDLGLAKNVGQSTAGMTATGMMMGSPHYISPEQASAKKEIDFRADIYSLGCTLYHMLTGRLPYEGDEPMAVMNLHVNAPPPAIFKVWPTCPMPLALLVGKMLKKNPRERHASYEELIAELTAVHEKLTAAQTAAAAPPSGTITFLFTDIEGSTQLWEKHPQAMPIALERHNQILRRAMESHGGFVFKTVGDAFCVAFASAPNAMAAALAGQRALSSEPWGATGPLRVRMALHTGAAEERGGDYFGPTVNRVARVLAAGHGGQILLSNATEQLVRDHLAEGVSLGDLGERSLKNLTRTERIFQVNLADMPTQFPTLRAAASPSTTRRRRQRVMLYGGAGAGVLVLLIGLLLWSPWSKPSSQNSNTPSLQHSAARPVDDAFIKEVAALSAEQQVARVVTKLKELNPGYDGQETHKIEDGHVAEIRCLSTSITNISPFRALATLRFLGLGASNDEPSPIADLSPLQGSQLTMLSIVRTRITDLSPLRGMKLGFLACQYTDISDLSPLRGMPLNVLCIHYTQVSDLSPLEGMRLRDLSCQRAKITDLSVLGTTPIQTLNCDFVPERDTKTLRSINTLREINGVPVADFWKRVEAGDVPRPPVSWKQPKNTPPSVMSSPAAASQQLGNVFTNSVGAEMVYIPPGEFMMGSTKEERAWAVGPEGRCQAKHVTCEGSAPRPARIRNGFWMGRTHVTVGQWRKFVEATGYLTVGEKTDVAHVFDWTGQNWRSPRSTKGKNWRDPNYGFSVQDNHPVTCVSWDDANAFCEWLTKKEREAGRLANGYEYRLPTEAEWEYACRGGRQGSMFWWGDGFSDGQGRLNIASDDELPNKEKWYQRVSWSDGFGLVSPVDHYGNKGRNGFGLADMLGNVLQFCLDSFDEAGAHEQLYTADTPFRVARGSTFLSEIGRARCACRINGGRRSANITIGFRVCYGVNVSGATTSIPSASSAAAPKEDGILAPVETRANALTVNPKAGEVFTLDVGKGASMDLMGIPAGEFMLGSTKEEQAWKAPFVGYIKNEGEAPRKTTIKQGFWMGRTEVTVGQWKEFATATGYRTEAEKRGYVDNALRKGRADGLSWRDPGFGALPQDNHPVCCVTWNDAVAFCEWLTERERKAGRLAAGHVVRLPTEAEWEYACRAGTQTMFWWGEKMEDSKGKLNFGGKSDGFELVAPVDGYGQPGRNKFGLADMLGNVQEWCLDGYDPKQAHEECYKGTSDTRVLRSGSFRNNILNTRCAFRVGSKQTTANADSGFRVAVGADLSGAATAAASTPRNADDAFTREVAALPAEQQAARVAAKLKELNPGFDGKVAPTVEGGKVVGLEFSTEFVADISPVRALSDLRSLVCKGSGENTDKWPGVSGKLTDLSPLLGLKLDSLRIQANHISDLTPLAGMPLTNLFCGCTDVADLRPLAGAPLKSLTCNKTKISDLSPLKGLPLRELTINYCEQITDLSPLKDMPLTVLGCYATSVSDLTPLKGMRLTLLLCMQTKVKDISPLREMPLTDLRISGTLVEDLSLLQDMRVERLQCNFKPERDTAILRPIRTLKTINGVPVAEFWKKVEAGHIPPPPSFAPKGGEVSLRDLGGGVTLETIYIPPGEFMLGSTKEEQAWAVANGGKAEYIKREGETPRKATIKQGFWMGRTEVTVGQWKQFVAVTGHASEAEKKGNACCYDRAAKTFTNMQGKSWRDPNFGAAPEDNHPVCCVSWNDAVVFCEWLTERERKAGRLPSGMVVRLPTEAEWEYACRAGTQTKFWWGESKEEGEGRLNWNGTADGFQYTSPVDHYGARGRNGFGLADMAGNVQEWCLDNYDPTGAHEECWKAGASRVLRGGSFYGLMPALARCACRNSFGPGVSNSSYGFRVVVASPR